jgi:hypothetical protein
LSSVDGRHGTESFGVLGCAFLTHTVAEARAIHAQLTDPATTSTVSCGETTVVVAPGPNETVLQFDLTAPKPSQSFTF